MRMVKLAALAAVVALAGCAGLKEAFYQPKLAVTQPVPAKINLGAAKKITLVQISQARAALKEKFVSEFTKQGRTGGVFQVEDKSETGITVNTAGRTVTASVLPAAGEAFLKADFIENSADSMTKTVTENGVQKQVTAYKGNVLLGFTAFNAKGKALAGDVQIEGTAEKATKDAAFDAAVANAQGGAARASHTANLDGPRVSARKAGRETLPEALGLTVRTHWASRVRSGAERPEAVPSAANGLGATTRRRPVGGGASRGRRRAKIGSRAGASADGPCGEGERRVDDAFTAAEAAARAATYRG